MKFAWRRPGGLPECPYFKLSMLDLGWRSLRVHEWTGDDDHRAKHDHGHWFWLIVLRGGYTDVSVNRETGEIRGELMRRGSTAFRAATHTHQVVDVLPGTITFLVCGPEERRWGFWKSGKIIKRDRYFAEDGHHGCVYGEAVRIRPDGSRIPQQEKTL